MGEGKSEVLQGTLDLMVLKTLYAMGPLHGFGIARRIEQVSDGVLDLNEGTVYTALLRLQQQGWIASKWGTSENNRRARFYSITRQGAKQLGARDGELGTRSGRNGAGAEARKAGVRRCGRLRTLWARVKGQAAQRREDEAFDDEIREHIALLEQRYRRRA